MNRHDGMDAGVGLPRLRSGWVTGGCCGCLEGANRRIRLRKPNVMMPPRSLNEYDEASPNLPGIFCEGSRPRGVKVSNLNEQAIQ